MRNKKPVIILPYRKYGNIGIDSKIVTGGTEMFSRLLFKNYPNVIPVEYSNDDVKQRKVADILLSAIKATNADMVLSNYCSSTTTVSIQRVLPKIKICAVVHTLSDSHPAFNFLKLAQQFSGVVAMVSQFQNQNWDDFAVRRNINRLKISSYILPAFCQERHIVKDTKKYSIATIGRADKYKDPYQLAKRVVIHNKKFNNRWNGLIITTNNGDRDYIAKNVSYSTHDDLNVFIDMDHKVNMDLLSTASVYLSTWPRETFGITALEALQRGIPVIACCNGAGAHASTILGDDWYIKLCAKKEPATKFADIYNDLNNFTIPQRQEIADRTYEKFSIDAWRVAIDELVEKTMDSNDSSPVIGN